MITRTDLPYRKRAQYRAPGQREYLIHLATGYIVVAQPFMRVDTFQYRNQQVSKKGLCWFISPEKINEYAKIKGGKLSANKHIWFPIGNLKWDKADKVLSSPSLYYFDGIGELDIKIKGKRDTVTFTNPKFEKIQTENGSVHQLTWSSPDTDIVFKLAWKHVGNRTQSVNVINKTEVNV